MTVSMTVSMSITSCSFAFYETMIMNLNGAVLNTISFDLVSSSLQDALWVMIRNDLGNKYMLGSAETPAVVFL